MIAWQQGTLLDKLLVFFGIAAIVCVIAVLLALAKSAIEEAVSQAKWEHRYKHRFDGAPTAKCWCKDCIWHRKDGRCELPGSDRYTPEEGFCYEAEPKNKDRGLAG